MVYEDDAQRVGGNLLSASRIWIVILLAAMATFVMALKAPLFVWASAGFDDAWQAVTDWTYYNVAFLSASYFNVGFVRRALGGTISRLLSSDPYRGAFLFHITSALFLIVPLALLQRRLLQHIRPTAAFLMILFAIFSPQMFMGWANDIARTDLLVIGTIAWSIWLYHIRHPVMAGAMLVIGFLVHETAIIFGLPLLIVVMAMGRDKERPISPAMVRMVGGVGITVLAIVLVQARTTPDMPSFAGSMMGDTPAPVDGWHADLRDCAIYMMITGLRGLQTAICYNLYWPGYVVVAVCAVAVTALNGVALNLERRAWGFSLAVMLPMLFMILIANDTGRWVKFACANAWLLSATYQLRGVGLPSDRRLMFNMMLVGGLIFLGSSTVHAVNRASVTIVRRIGIAPPPEVAEWMTHCDPRWRDVAHSRP